MSVRCEAESFHRLARFINTTFRAKIYTRWCCIDRLSRHDISGGCSVMLFSNRVCQVSFAARE